MRRISTLITVAAIGLLLLLCLVCLAYFVTHAAALLAFPYPLDYGEGPLLAQIELLRSGTPLWQLYADPQAPPYMVVNYPPLYPLVVTALAPLTGGTLVAGRLVSLFSALACVGALVLLAGRRWTADGGRRTVDGGRWAVALLFLTIPIVREWAVLLRVDMLGVALGLWGLAALEYAAGSEARMRRWWALLTGLLLLACLYTKPSLIAAPGAACAWLLWEALRGRQRDLALLVFGVLALGGGGLLALLQWASDGWFMLHVVTANANRWEYALARGFWEAQAELRWSLAAAAALVLTIAAWRSRSIGWPRLLLDPHPLTLPALYTLAGIVTAAGVGKVGAYSNYFLELYAGLIWIVAAGIRDQGSGIRDQGPAIPSASLRASGYPFGFAQGYRLSAIGYRLSAILLLILSMAFYPPLWDKTRLRPAGLIEPSPPRLVLGRHSLWADQRREWEVLEALGRAYALLLPEVRAAGPLIFTDMPGSAAAAGVASRMQLFEQRQLLDQGLWDQRPLLLELANGAIPLAVLDYLGNWLTPEMITIIERRYAYDGPRGTFDLYRPVEAGPVIPANLRFEAEGLVLQLSGYQLGAPAGAAPGEPYDTGELLPVTLTWQRGVMTLSEPLTVVLQLAGEGGAVLLEYERLLLYGAFPPEQWPEGAPVQHMQPLALPADLSVGVYRLTVGLRAAGRDLGAPQELAHIAVSGRGGRTFEETGYHVPATLLAHWERLGGIERVGYPLTPAVPFAWGRLQCFERLCLEQRGAQVEQRPLGELLYLAETIRGEGCMEGSGASGEPCPYFAGLWEVYANSLGPPLSGELLRNGYRVQWTKYARLEREPAGGPAGLGRLGDDALRLPPGMRYRWP